MAVQTFVNEKGQTVALDSNGSWKVYDPATGKFGAYAKGPQTQVPGAAPSGTTPGQSTTASPQQPAPTVTPQPQPQSPPVVLATAPRKTWSHGRDVVWGMVAILAVAIIFISVMHFMPPSQPQLNLTTDIKSEFKKVVGEEITAVINDFNQRFASVEEQIKQLKPKTPAKEAPATLPPATVPAPTPVPTTPKVDITIDNWEKLAPLERQGLVYKYCPSAKWPEDETGLVDNWSLVALEKFSLAEAHILAKTCNIGLLVAKVKTFEQPEAPVVAMQKPLCRGVAECGKAQKVRVRPAGAPEEPYFCNEDWTPNPRGKKICGPLNPR